VPANEEKQRFSNSFSLRALGKPRGNCSRVNFEASTRRVLLVVAVLFRNGLQRAIHGSTSRVLLVLRAPDCAREALRSVHGASGRRLHVYACAALLAVSDRAGIEGLLTTAVATKRCFVVSSADGAHREKE